MTIRVAVIEVSHWHALHDAAYLRHLIAMPDVELVAIQDSDAGLVARRAAEVGSPPTFTDYQEMLVKTRPDFVVALGRHRQMAGIAHDLLDQGYPFLMEKPMGINAAEVEAVAAKAARLDAFVAVPLSASRIAVFDQNVLMLNEPRFPQPLQECGDEGRRRRAVKNPDHGHRALLRARRERPCRCRRAAEQRYELAAFIKKMQSELL
jgi:Oxidoreductase family, NAD-binding Rossmann fold